MVLVECRKAANIDETQRECKDRTSTGNDIPITPMSSLTISFLLSVHISSAHVRLGDVSTSS